MTTITEHCVVAFHFDAFNELKEKVQSSRPGLPQLFLYGDDGVLQALQKAMLGHKIGDCIRVQLNPAEAYGHHDPDLVQTLPIGLLPDNNLSSGDCIVAHTPDGNMNVRIISMDSEHVTLDGNHPLAGQALDFDLEIRHVRPASIKEKQFRKAIA